MYKELMDIPDYKYWTLIKKIDKGWSADIKYYIEDCNKNKLLLRLSDISMLNPKKKEFEIIKKYNSLPFEMSKVISFGICNSKQNIYILLTWVEGESLITALPKLSEKAQYRLGLEAGNILKEIHSIPIRKSDMPVENRQERKVKKLIKYENSSIRIDNDQDVLKFIKKNINKLNSLPPVYTHGDFHVGNLILTPHNTIGVIDFNRWKCGDVYEEFYKVQFFDIEVSIPFSIGQIDGYFNNDPPFKFWDILSVYVAHSSLTAINWAETFGEDEINGMKLRCINAFKDFNNFKSIIPNWYKDNYKKYRTMI
ncbi:aminoglycoside phosphotransferase family protein [Clostridium sardiniense]|nr:phosphotransferase [Clostridium sardiniense]MDQ0459204.1 aminoglycoside phosphotransferase (APT) family kinase protein [Clostridium sardiniense]